MITIEKNITVTISDKDFQTLSNALEIARRAIDSGNFCKDLTIEEVRNIKNLFNTVWDS